MTIWNPPSPGSSNSGFQLPLTGVVNGVNQTFTWATEPNQITVDTATMIIKGQASASTANWVLSGSGPYTTVLTVPPNDSISSPA
jgi:hypothetical protein